VALPADRPAPPGGWPIRVIEPNGVALPPPASSPTWMADVPLHVEPGMGPAEVALQTGAAIMGRVTFDLPNASLSPEVLARVAITYAPQDARQLGGQNGEIPWSRLEADGSFVSVGLFPQRYRVRLALSVVPELRGWSVGSMRVDEREVELVEVGTSDTQVDLTLTSRPMRVAGTARDASGRPAAGAAIVMFAVDPLQRAELRPWRVVAGEGGRFEFTRLRPGSYFVGAVASTPVSWTTREYLASLVAIAKPVTVALGQTQEIDLAIGAP
jgi:hypothetical protein